MTTLAAALDAAIAAVCPITGVSIGKIDDKATWKIRFAQSATPQQQAAAAAALAAFVYVAPKKLDIDDLVELLETHGSAQLQAALAAKKAAK